MWLGIKKQFRRIPLLGPLVDCHARDHVETIGQTIAVLLLSTTPLWIGALVVYATSGTPLSLSAAFIGTISNGEFFMYSTALIAPIFWVALVDPPRARVFPSKFPHMLLMAVIDIIASVFFGLSVAGNHLREPFAFQLSVGLFIASLILLYLGTLYHASRMDASEIIREDEKFFENSYREHRRD